MYVYFYVYLVIINLDFSLFYLQSESCWSLSGWPYGPQDYSEIVGMCCLGFTHLRRRNLPNSTKRPNTAWFMKYFNIRHNCPRCTRVDTGFVLCFDTFLSESLSNVRGRKHRFRYKASGLYILHPWDADYLRNVRLFYQKGLNFSNDLSFVFIRCLK